MIKCVVEMFGLPHRITELREVELRLKNGANLRDVVAALRCAIPALEGRVIRAGEDRLTEYYAFSINGQFYINDQDIKLKDGDSVMLLTLATGG